MELETDCKIICTPVGKTMPMFLNREFLKYLMNLIIQLYMYVYLVPTVKSLMTE